MPLILPLIPLIGLTVEHSFRFHAIMAFIIGIIAYFAFRSGYKRHGNRLPTFIGSMGVLFLFVGGGFEALGVDSLAFLTTITGSFSLILAHYKNHKYSCSCEHHHV